MNLLFQRAQGTGPLGLAEKVSVPSLPLGFSSPKFKLWAKIELEPEEQTVVDHYHFDKAVLIDSDQPELLKKSAYVALAAFCAGTVLFFTMMHISAAIFLGLLAGGAAGYFYFDKNRETIFVSDLLHGRNFSCRSVIELARKEAWLETVCAFLRQVMESAKHWDGTEAIPIKALDKDVAKQIIIKGL
jgi:hypothetical protein